MSYKNRLIVVTAILLTSVILDQVTKRMAIAWLMDHPPIVYMGDFFRLQYAENTGAFLGLFGTKSAVLRNVLLIGFNSVILIGVSLFLFRPKQLSATMAVAFALILSGGMGNLIDRIAYGGVVVDFMNMGLPWVSIRGWEPRTGIFNVADLAIMGGLLLVIIAEFLKPKTEAASESDAPKQVPAND